MKKIARKIIHYVGLTIKMPFVALFIVSYLAVYYMQLASVVVRMAFDESNPKSPIASLVVCLRDIADELEELI